MRGRRQSGRWFLVCTLPNGHVHDRLGLVVARRLAGSAVARNGVKRIIREVFRARGDERRRAGLDIVVQLRALPASRREAREELTSLMARAAR